MRLHRTAQLAAKNHAASFASLAKPPKKKGYNSFRESKSQSGFGRFRSAPVKRLPLGADIMRLNYYGDTNRANKENRDRTSKILQ
jgi:hypothetical protein